MDEPALDSRVPPGDRAHGRLPVLAATLPALLFALIYLGRAGRGFILDDYGWIAQSRISNLMDLVRLFGRENGFYRPVVGLTFGFDYTIYGLESRGYGLTNVLLALACGWLVFRLARAFDLPWGAAAFAASLWLLNFHGASGGVLWISGRSALVLTALAVAAAILVLRGRFMVGAFLAGLAMFAKEEAVVLPFLFGAWIVVRNRPKRTESLAVWAGSSALSLAAYFGLRDLSGAMTLDSAPAHYQLTFDAASVFKNVSEYADRTFTLPLICILAALALLGRGRTSAAQTEPIRRDLIACALAWIGCGYALTLFVPVRSSLYVCLPLVGACLIAAELVRSLWDGASSRQRTRALYAAVCVSLLAAPIHYSRTAHLATQAELARSVLSELPALTQGLDANTLVVIEDATDGYLTIRSVFGPMLPLAHELVTGRDLNVWIEPASHADGPRPCLECPTRRLALRGGRLMRVD